MSDETQLAQARTRRWKTVLILVGLGLALSVTGCGKRAGKIDPPPDVEDDKFPRTYPDPATDPTP